MDKILLICMPFGALDRPALGISMLKAQLSELGIHCDIRYLNFAFAEFIGYEDYLWISAELPYTAFAGDWAFTQSLYGVRPEADEQYIQKILFDAWQLDQLAVKRILHIRSLIPHFLDYCLAAIDWSSYAVIGFTSTFEQNLASLALARRLKEEHPQAVVVMGGANWEGKMGYELHRQFSFVDYVCSGEADHSFPELVRHILANQTGVSTIPGVIYRSLGVSRFTVPISPVSDMDSLPVPDFTDYFRDLTQCTIGSSVVPILLLETSRGCWWGAKSHCTFCGLNGETMSFRSKSSGQALMEIKYLVNRWQIEFVMVVDNILDMRYFRDMLPALAEMQWPVRLFYEVKANLTRKQVQMLHAAGVHRIQPGIESMSDHVLKLMRKGTTALRNVQLLKWCKEYGIAVDWNILYGFPGETQKDYDDMLAFLPTIRFLGVPTGYGPVRMDRFSPYFNDPETYGLSNVRPMAPYKYLYPFCDEVSLYRIAYYFDYDYVSHVDPTGYADQVIDYIIAWQRQPEKGILTSVEQLPDTLQIIDTRFELGQATFELSGLEKSVYEYCDTLHSFQSIERYLRREFPNVPFMEQGLQEFLDSLVANNLMVTDGAYYLSLAIPMRAIQTNSSVPAPMEVSVEAGH